MASSRAGVVLVLLGLLSVPQSSGGIWRRVPTREVHKEAKHKEAASGMHIAKIIHQSWKTSKLPAGFGPWQDSWKRNHPGWEYK